MIGSHTWNHYDITTGTIDQLGNQLDLVETALLKILGVKPALFRPPYGNINVDITSYLNSRDYTVVGWSDDSQDSADAPIDQQIALLNNEAEGSIMLAHETRQSPVDQLVPAIIPGLLAKGVKLMTLDQCLAVARGGIPGGGGCVWNEGRHLDLYRDACSRIWTDLSIKSGSRVDQESRELQIGVKSLSPVYAVFASL